MKYGKFTNLPENERLIALETNSSSSALEEVQRSLSDKQISSMKDRLTYLGMRDLELDEQVKYIMQPIKEELKSIKEETKKTLETLRNGFINSEERVFHFKNEETGEMETYDAEGEFISSRRLRPDERQHTLVIPIDGTNGQ